MFLEKEELKSVVYKYQIDQIVENEDDDDSNDDIIYMAINAAIDEVKSYIRPNNKREWMDGRLRYDVDKVFNATGTDRNALLLEVTKNIALWNVCRLCNVDMIYEQTKDRYDRAIDWLKKVNKGDITLDLPTVQDSTPPEDGSADGLSPFRSGSRRKFRHE